MKKQRTYFDRVHTWGRIWTIGAFFALFSVPLIFSIVNNVWPESGPFFKGLMSVLPLYWATGVIETVTYVPMLGAGGTYLSFVTGNIANLKLPCAISALNNAEVKSNSDEGEVISTIAIASSAITTTAIIAAGVLLLGPFIVKMTAEGSLFAPAFEQVLPALFGALLAAYLKKYWSIALFTVGVGCIILVFSPSLAAGTLLVFTIIAAIGFSFLLTKLNVIK